MAAIRPPKPSSRASGRSACSSRSGRCAIPRPCYRSGRRRVACRRRPIANSRAPGRITIRSSASPWNCPTARRRKGLAHPNARRSRPRRPRCCPPSALPRTRSMPEQTMTATDTRCGFVALIGAPNAGKSTLLNALVGSKVTIVSHKVQTTRALIRGITVANQSQLIFVDTPGIFTPKRRLDRAMVTTAWSGAHDADLVGLLIDARKGLDEENEAILERLADVRQPKLLILNKVDLVAKEPLLALAQTANDKAKFE